MSAPFPRASQQHLPIAQFLLETLTTQRALLLELAPRYLSAEAREGLVDQILNPDKAHGIVAKMICTVLAGELSKRGVKL